jgi:molecular chaperone DnaK (HSP70)
MVLMVGGSSLIPPMQRTVQRIFGRERVRLENPLDAVARGAAAFVAGVDFYDHIQHDYAIRYVNPQKGDYDFRILVQRGTPYPSQEPVVRNEHSPTFLTAQPPARHGEARFEVVFGIDGNKRLLITARDMQTQRVTHRDYPVVKLT